MSRASQGLLLQRDHTQTLDACRQAIGWYLSRRSAEVQKAKWMGMRLLQLSERSKTTETGTAAVPVPELVV